MDKRLLRSYESRGLNPGATLTEAKEAYRDLTKVWHPDRFTHESARLRKKAEDQTKEINEAYRVIVEHIVSEARQAKEASQYHPSPPSHHRPQNIRTRLHSLASTASE